MRFWWSKEKSSTGFQQSTCHFNMVMRKVRQKHLEGIYIKTQVLNFFLNCRKQQVLATILYTIEVFHSLKGKNVRKEKRKKKMKQKFVNKIRNINLIKNIPPMAQIQNLGSTITFQTNSIAFGYVQMWECISKCPYYHTIILFQFLEWLEKCPHTL